ncbi:MAG: hypothetical protein AAB298_08030, partial [Pseudomonadota bacterium]
VGVRAAFPDIHVASGSRQRGNLTYCVAAVRAAFPDIHVASGSRQCGNLTYCVAGAGTNKSL